MTPESIALNTYFGVELRDEELPIAVAGLICKTAAGVNTLFRRLEVMDVITIGGRRFVRCRSDVLNPHLMLDVLFDLGRAVIVPGEGGYMAWFVRRKGPVPNMTMHTTPRPGQRTTYRGPGIKLWAEQFR